MYDLETSPRCAPTHYRGANQWLRRPRGNDPILQWLVRPSRLGKDFIEYPKPAAKSGRRSHRQIPVAVSVRSDAVGELLETRFARLVAEWREAIENVSSLTQIVSNRSYQSIIDLGKRGEPVVRLILRDLQNAGGYWATALNAITGENPVASKHIGNPAKVREDWITWGQRQGYL
jgi:hypothetical protein